MLDGGKSVGGDGVAADIELGLPREFCRITGVILVAFDVGEGNLRV
jgi:hypothetical protein